MSSPFRRSEYTRSSPSRSRANGHHVARKDGSYESPELYEEFARLVVDSDRQFKKILDQQSLEQQKKHVEALEVALAKHNAVRKSAEETSERIRLELEAERIRLEREEFERREAARRKVAEEQRKKEEAAQQAALRRRQEEEARVAAQKKLEEDQKARERAALERAEADRRAQEQATQAAQAAQQKAAAEEAAKQKQSQVPQTSSIQPNGTSTTAPQQPANQSSPTTLPSGVTKSSEECQNLYSQYLEIHGRLKRLREDLPARTKQDPRLVNLSDWRRELTKLLGQINVTDKAANREIIKNVRAVLDNCAQFPDYVTDVAPYFLPSRTNGQPLQGSIILVFLFNHLVKSAIKSMEANLQPLPPNEMAIAADNFGIVLATLFGDSKYRIGDISFADILWSKYHQQCPVLFGIRRAGKRPVECLAAGFAAITLRDFSKNKNPNPFPNRLFWEAVARIVNTPPASQSVIHYQILHMLFQPQFAARFIQFYGKAGLVAMRNAIIRFPTTAPANNERVQSQAKSVVTLAIALDRDLHLKLS